MIIDGFEVSIRSRIFYRVNSCGIVQHVLQATFFNDFKKFVVFAGCSVVSDLLFIPVDIGKVEVSCYDYIWWDFLCSV